MPLKAGHFSVKIPGQVSVEINIHVYGANIGAVRRHVFDIADGGVRSFTSGYSSVGLPNVWDRSKEDLSVGR